MFYLSKLRIIETAEEKTEIDYAENFDLQNIVTLVNAQLLVKELKRYEYNPQEIKFLQESFTKGFNIGYQGPVKRNSRAKNIPLRVGNETIVE